MEKNRLRLHLGCGDKKIESWINIDSRKLSGVDLVQDLENLKKFKDNSVEVIYASHLLEHFSHKKTNKILQEWARVLKKGGKIFLAVPDFNKLLLKFLILRDTKVIKDPLLGAQDYPSNFHQAIFNFKSLKRELKTAGLSKIKKIKKFSFLPKEFIDSSQHWCSLNISAQKSN